MLISRPMSSENVYINLHCCKYRHKGGEMDSKHRLLFDNGFECKNIPLTTSNISKKPITNKFGKFRFWETLA